MSSCAPRGPHSRSSAAPLYLDLRSREGGRLGVGCQVGVLLFLKVVQKARTRPRAYGAAPKFGGLLGEDLGVEVRVGALVKLTADLGAPRRKTPTFKKPRDRPTLGGSAKRGGRVLALCTTCNKKPTKPGGQRRALARKRGACPRNLQNRRNEQNTDLTTSHPVSQKPCTQRQVCPLF